jgi:hypothetical protein
MRFVGDAYAQMCEDYCRGSAEAEARALHAVDCGDEELD